MAHPFNFYRAADMGHKPTIKETKFLLPKPALSAKDIKPPQWVNMVQQSWEEVQGLSTAKAKAKVLETLSDWPLFGSSFFAVMVNVVIFHRTTSITGDVEIERLLNKALPI